MGEAIITRRGGVGSGKAFAVIGVTYPAGSTCTCTNGTKTLRAKDTSGLWNFLVPEAGTWTVTATDGGKTASKQVEITTRGENQTAFLSYRFDIIKDGVAVVSPSNNIYSAISTDADGYKLAERGNGTPAISFRVDNIRAGSTIKLNVIKSYDWNDGQNQYTSGLMVRSAPITASKNKQSHDAATIAYTLFNYPGANRQAITPGVYEVPVSSDLTDVYVCYNIMYIGDSDPLYITVSDLWIE